MAPSHGACSTACAGRTTSRSPTSAGALNGAAFKAGFVSGGREGAKENLDWLRAQMGVVEDLRLTNWMQTVLPGPALFISATNVRTGKIRVFEGSEISTPAILASACLSMLFQAVEIAPAPARLRPAGTAATPPSSTPACPTSSAGPVGRDQAHPGAPRIGEGATVDLEEMFG